MRRQAAKFETEQNRILDFPSQTPTEYAYSTRRVMMFQHGQLAVPRLRQSVGCCLFNTYGRLKAQTMMHPVLINCMIDRPSDLLVLSRSCVYVPHYTAKAPCLGPVGVAHWHRPESGCRRHRWTGPPEPPKAVVRLRLPGGRRLAESGKTKLDSASDQEKGCAALVGLDPGLVPLGLLCIMLTHLRALAASKAARCASLTASSFFSQLPPRCQGCGASTMMLVPVWTRV